jgi:hypothetical protein
LDLPPDGEIDSNEELAKNHNQSLANTIAKAEGHQVFHKQQVRKRRERKKCQAQAKQEAKLREFE